MLFTDAKGGNLCFFNNDLHREQIQTELEMLDTTLLNSLYRRRRESFASIKDPPLYGYNNSRD